MCPGTVLDTKDAEINEIFTGWAFRKISSIA